MQYFQLCKTKLLSKKTPPCTKYLITTEEHKFEHKTICYKTYLKHYFYYFKSSLKYPENCRCKQLLCKKIKQLMYPGVFKKRKLFEADRYSVAALLHSCQENDI